MMFSIIIPTYNRAHIIREAVNSVLHQTLSDFEVLVIDDGSTDDTRILLEGMIDPRMRYHYKKNEERSIARNFGADKARGRYLIFLDSDDKLAPEHLETIHRYLVSHHFEPRFLYLGYKVYTPGGNLLYHNKKSGKYRPSSLLFGNSLGCSPVVVEKKLFDAHRFDTSPDLILFEDWELWLRIISKEQLHCIPSGSVIMTNHTGRSVLNASAAQLETKANCLRSLVMQHSPMVKHSPLARRRFNMGVYSYVALHIALSKSRRFLSLKYLVKAFGQDPGIVLRRRFYGILKQIL